MRGVRQLLMPHRDYIVTLTNRDTKTSVSSRHVGGTPPHVGQELIVKYVDGEIFSVTVMSGGRKNGAARFVVNHTLRPMKGQRLHVIGVSSV